MVFFITQRAEQQRFDLHVPDLQDLGEEEARGEGTKGTKLNLRDRHEVHYTSHRF